MLKKVCSPLLALCLLLTVEAGAQELAKRLSNQDIIDMANLGLSDDVIIAKIRADQDAKFDTSTDGLKALKAAKVSDAVIRVMINPKVMDAPPVAAAPAEDPNLPPREVGVYWKNGTEFVLVEGQIVSQAKIGGRAAHRFSFGIASKHWNAYLTGPESKNKVKDLHPVFYFYVMEGASPSDYTLLKLDKKGDRRQFEVGSIGGWTGQKSGTREGNAKGFEYQRVASRTYKVTLTEDLKPGEYGFFMGTGQQMAMSDREAGGSAQGRIYDFSIPQ